MRLLFVVLLTLPAMCQITVSPASGVPATVAQAVALESTFKQHILVTLPPGTYPTADVVLPDDGFCANIIGSGPGVTVIKPAGVSTGALLTKGQVSVPQRCRIENLTIDMSGQPGKCFDLQRLKGWTITNVDCIGSTNASESASIGYAFKGAGAYELDMRNVSISSTSPYGLHLLSGATDSEYANVRVIGAKTAGLLNEGGGNRFYGFHPYPVSGGIAAPYCVVDWGKNTYVASECDTFQIAAFDWNGANSLASATQVIQPAGSFSTAALAKYESTAARNDLVGVTATNSTGAYTTIGNVAGSLIDIQPPAPLVVTSFPKSCTITIPNVVLTTGTASGTASFAACQ